MEKSNLNPPEPKFDPPLTDDEKVAFEAMTKASTDYQATFFDAGNRGAINPNALLLSAALSSISLNGLVDALLSLDPTIRKVVWEKIGTGFAQAAGSIRMQLIMAAPAPGAVNAAKKQ